MDFDFVRYKARVLQTTAFNVILFSVDIGVQSQIQVKAVKIGSKPFIVVWASPLQVDAIARTLTAKHIATEITMQSATNIIAVALTALHMAIPMDECIEIDVTGRVCSVAPAEIDIETLLGVLTEMKTPTSIQTSVGVLNAVDLIATLRACEYTTTQVQLSEALVALLALRPDVPIDIKTDTVNALDLDVYMRTRGPVGISSNSVGDLGFSVIVSPDGAVAIYAPGEYELTATAEIDLDDSRAIASDAESAGAVTVVVRLLGYVALADYDADTLASLDPSSLQALAYIEI